MILLRIYIQEKENLIKFNLPSKIDGSMLFSYKSFKTGLESSLNIDAENGKWVLKSNGNINALNTPSDGKIVLEEYMYVPINVVSDNSYLCMFCLPSIEQNEQSYEVIRKDTIKIGRGVDNDIIYDQNQMLQNHAIIKLQNSQWYIMPAVSDAKIYIYVNNKRVLMPTRLNVGDVIFMNGLRIIWMKSFIKIHMSTKLYKIQNLLQIENKNDINNRNYTEVTEAESNMPLYNENDYFSHSPRFRSSLEKEEIRIDAPPPNQEKESDMPFLLSIASSFSLLGMSAVNMYNIISRVASGEDDIQNQIPGIMMFISMMAGSLIVPIITKKFQAKIAHKKEIKRQDKYGKYLKTKEEKLNAVKKKQEQIIIENNPDLTSCLTTLQKRNRFLWNKEIKDDDFIEVRLGIGDRPSQISVTAPEESFSLDDDNLLQAVYELGKRYETLNNVPITVGFKDQIVTALILSGTKSNEFLNGIMLQLVTYHSPLDLKIVVITDEINANKWNYVKYIPHCWSDDKSIRFFATNQDDLKSLCAYLDTEFHTRIEKKQEKEKASKEVNKEKVEEYELYESYYLIITDNFKAIRNFSFTNDLLENQYNYGFSMVILDKNMKNLPKECQKFVVINDNESGMFSSKMKESDTIKFQAEYANGINMREVGRIIGNIPIQGKDEESQLPGSLSFLEMYNVGKIEQLNIRNRWLNSDPIQTLQTPIGVHTNGEIFTLDLHEKADGPHGLIAGSTGSGKSEFIITFILSMAINYDPKEVQFVLIDYKGGGLAGAFENREQGVSIPHLAGTITNLDTAEMNRTLVSIESELKRRQKKFNEEREKVGESTMDIYKYQRLYREGLIDTPISHLFIVSDEFAELKAQQPDFMAQLVSTARIGRSLGVHLILATQKPSGVVNDQIWSNSRFKICLKVQSKADSMEMLKRPEAASIKETGRFYLQVGYDEYFDIGQSAWSGEKYVPTERIIKKLDDSLAFVDNSGNIVKKANDIQKIKVVNEDLGDQLTNIVKYLQKISEEEGIKPKKLWLPSLEKVLTMENLLKKYKYTTNANEFIPIIGEYDAPALQKQDLLKFNLLEDGNILIYGTPGSGKENLITTIVYSLSIFHSPKEINFYIGDFGAETLKILQKLPQVGDVFLTEETNKLENLVKMLDKELERRKKEYSDYGGNYQEYCKLSGNKDNVIVVALNNYENFVETYPRMTDLFTNFFRDGGKYGIFFIVSTTVSTAIRSRVAQNFMNKVCLKMPNDYDYRDLLGSPKGLIPVDNYGRGIVSVDGKFAYEFQTANICDRELKTQFIREKSEILKQKYPNMKAKKIPVLPEIAYVEDVQQDLHGITCVPIGIEKNTLETYVYNFTENRINLIAAKSMKNHIYFIYALVKQLSSLKNTKVHVIDTMSIYKKSYKDVDLYQNQFDKVFEKIYNNVSNDKECKVQNVYLCIGISEFKKIIYDKYKEYYEKMFKAANKCKNNVFLLFDDSEGYKHIQLENWFKDNINNTFGIWLGEDIGVQVALGVMSISVQDTKELFPCIGYPIYQGNHMTVKYVVDGVDKKDEQ